MYNKSYFTPLLPDYSEERSIQNAENPPLKNPPAQILNLGKGRLTRVIDLQVFAKKEFNREPISLPPIYTQK